MSKWLSYLHGPIVLQVVSVGDIYCSIIDASFKNPQHRCPLRFGLTDGICEAVAVEFSPTPFINEEIAPGTKELVKGEWERWAAEGINVKYETCKDRARYKAGNLKGRMRHAYVRGCEFVAMFDADFQPAPDFLVKTVPFLIHNPSLALVQTRWKFAAL